jgi:DNA-directed RNA polymerase specialized sigma24 family protein
MMAAAIARNRLTDRFRRNKRRMQDHQVAADKFDQVDRLERHFTPAEMFADRVRRFRNVRSSDEVRNLAMTPEEREQLRQSYAARSRRPERRT